MEKSENGYPRRSPRTVMPEGRAVDDGSDVRVRENRVRRDCEGNLSGGGGGCSDCLSDKPLAYSYTPIQKWELLYTPEDGLKRGTLFEMLDKPPEVYGNE